MNQPNPLRISFLGTDHLTSNMQSIIDFASKKSGYLMNTFRESILYLQSPEIILEDTKLYPIQNWNLSNQTFKKSLADVLSSDDFHNDWRFTQSDIDRYKIIYNAALNLFEKTYPQLFSNFKKMIFSIIFAKREGFFGGSVSSRIGIIWLAPNDSWTIEIWTENLIHEFVHHCLFLEDMVTTVFPHGASVMSQEDALVMSSIRRVKRGLDKAYHSAFVSYALLLFYLKLGNRKQAIGYLNPLLICVEDLTKNQKHLSKNGKDLLNELVKNLIHTTTSIQEEYKLMVEPV